MPGTPARAKYLVSQVHADLDTAAPVAHKDLGVVEDVQPSRVDQMQVQPLGEQQHKVGCTPGHGAGVVCSSRCPVTRISGYAASGCSPGGRYRRPLNAARPSGVSNQLR